MADQMNHCPIRQGNAPNGSICDDTNELWQIIREGKEAYREAQTLSSDEGTLVNEDNQSVSSDSDTLKNEDFSEKEIDTINKIQRDLSLIENNMCNIVNYIEKHIKEHEHHWESFLLEMQAFKKKEQAHTVAIQQHSTDVAFFQAEVKHKLTALATLVTHLIKSQANLKRDILIQESAKHKLLYVIESCSEISTTMKKMLAMKNCLIAHIQGTEKRLKQNMDEFLKKMPHNLDPNAQSKSTVIPTDVDFTQNVPVTDVLPSPPPQTSNWWSFSSLGKVKKIAVCGLACAAVSAVAYGVVKYCMK